MVEHVNIPDAHRHEAKGASTAAQGQYLTANGDGTTSWAFLDYSDLANRPVAQGYLPVLYGASSASSQQPSATNTPLQVEFGQAATGTGVSLSSTGALTFTQAGQYIVNMFFRLGRTGGSGGVARIFTRILVNGVAVLRPAGAVVPGVDDVTTLSVAIPINASVNDVVTVQLIRDSSGVNEGGLIQLTPSLAGWSASPSASINVAKFGGLV